MKSTVTTIDVVTRLGRRLLVQEIQNWIDASSKDDLDERMPGKIELRTMSGGLIAFEGSVFTLADVDTFDPPRN